MDPFCLKSVALLGSLTGSICNYFFLLNASIYYQRQTAFDTAGKCELTFSFVGFFLFFSHSLTLGFIHPFTQHLRNTHVGGGAGWHHFTFWKKWWHGDPVKHRRHNPYIQLFGRNLFFPGILDKGDHWRGKLPFTSKAVLCLDETSWGASQRETGLRFKWEWAKLNVQRKSLMLKIPQQE